jgi:rare lipoprotein A (peptidoglycan hydrolase)
VIALLAGAFALPAAALASSFGGGSGIPSGSSGTSNPKPAVANNGGTEPQSGNVAVSESGNGITLSTNSSALLRNQLSFSGTASSGHAGQTVEIERLGHQTDWQWTPTVHTTVGSDGSFSASWHTNHIGRFQIRAVMASRQFSSFDSSPGSSLTVTVYRPSIATQYGPGFYGQRTACGETLTPSTIGVANRTLRCGMKVAIYWHGHTMIVPVIDRGPYANHADWDLTEATGQTMGIDGTAKIGAVSLPSPPRGTQ